MNTDKKKGLEIPIRTRSRCNRNVEPAFANDGGAHVDGARKGLTSLIDWPKCELTTAKIENERAQRNGVYMVLNFTWGWTAITAAPEAGHL